MSRGFFNICIFAALTVALALTPSMASADTSHGQFLVSVTVIDTCRIAMRHMDISGSAASQEAARGVVALNCSKHTAYDISIGSGIDAASPPVLASISGLGDGATQMIPVYSKVPARISEANGVSTRVLTMTITY